MNKEEVISKVVQAATQIQEVSGRPTGHMGANTRPIRDLTGFDSLSGLEATMHLSELVGHEFPDDYNAFVSKDGRRALSIQEIAEEVCSTLAEVEVHE